MTTKGDIRGPWYDAYFNESIQPNLIYYACPKNCTNSIKKMITLDSVWHRCGTNCPLRGRIIPVQQDFYDKKKFFSFGFVRNPYDRFYSAYKMLLTEWTVLGRPQLPMAESFDIFVTAVYKKDFKDNHVRKQIDFIPVKLDPQVNFIGRYENFENDWFLLQEKINHKFVDKVVKKQASDYQKMIDKGLGIEPTKVMSSKSLKMLQKFYHDDFVNFGYDFDELAGFKIT